LLEGSSRLNLADLRVRLLGLGLLELCLFDGLLLLLLVLVLSLHLLLLVYVFLRVHMMNHLLELLVELSVVLEELPHLGLELAHVVLLVLKGPQDVQEVVVHLIRHLALQPGKKLNRRIELRVILFEFEPVREELVHFQYELRIRLQLVLYELQHPCQLVCVYRSSANLLESDILF